MTKKTQKKNTPPIKVAEKKPKGFNAVLTMDGKQYKGEGQTIYDALTDIPLDWTQIKVKGIIEVSDGKKKAEKLFYLKPLKMLFANKLRRYGWAKNFQTLLDN